VANDSSTKELLLSFVQIARVLIKQKDILRSWVCNQTKFEDRNQFAARRKACCE